MRNLEPGPSSADLPVDQLATIGFSLAMQMLASREDASDAVQDSLHQVLKHRNRFDSRRGELKSWFLKIVRNRCIDLARAKKRAGIDGTDVATMPEPNMQTPDRVAEQREMLDLLKSELLGMPLDRREIIVLRDFHQLSYAEIADVLSISPGTVMSRLHRARSDLRQRMEKHR